MATSSSSRETFDDSDTWHDEMHSTIEAWIQDLVNEVDSAVSSEQFTEWLDVQSRFSRFRNLRTEVRVSATPVLSDSGELKYRCANRSITPSTDEEKREARLERAFLSTSLVPQAALLRPLLDAGSNCENSSISTSGIDSAQVLVSSPF